MAPGQGNEPVGDSVVYEVVPFEERLGVALAAASRALGTRYRTSLARLQLTYPQFQVMQVLWEDGSLMVGTLADRLALDISTFSPCSSASRRATWCRDGATLVTSARRHHADAEGPGAAS